MDHKTLRFRVESPVKLAHFIQGKVGGSIKGIRRCLERNCCKVNGCIERFGSMHLPRGAIVEWTLQEKTRSKIEILYENPSLLIANKQAGWVCTQTNCAKEFGKNRLLVHRLDKDTTGALLIATSDQIKDELIELFRTFQVEKEYLAIVDGVVRKDEWTIDNVLAKKGSFEGQTIWGSAPNGQRAITHFKVLKRGSKETLLSCRPITGRTHQIRVHLAEIGHPILIDRQYSKSFKSDIQTPRPLLHSHRLEFDYHKEKILVICPLPEEFPSI